MKIETIFIFRNLVKYSFYFLCDFVCSCHLGYRIYFSLSVCYSFRVAIVLGIRLCVMHCTRSEVVTWKFRTEVAPAVMAFII